MGELTGLLGEVGGVTMAQHINARELTEWQAKAVPLVLIDVRFAQIGTIPEAIHVPVTDLEDREWHWDPNARIVVFCQYGRGASEYAAEVLEEQGYSQVFQLIGGIEAWNAALSPG